MQIINMEMAKSSLTCMVPDCGNKADYKATIDDSGMRLNVLICYSCYMEGKTLDIISPEKTSKTKTIKNY